MKDFVNRNLRQAALFILITAAAASIPAVSSASNYVLAAGGEHSLALRIDDGKIWSWGDNAYGQLGTGDNYGEYMPTVISVPLQQGTQIIQIAAGGHHTLALDDSGHVWAWGANDQGQLGIGRITDQNFPIQVKDQSGNSVLEGIVYIAAGAKHSLAVTSDGAVWAWGWNEYGQLGHGDTISTSLPVEVSLPLGTYIEMVSAGDHHSVGKTSAGNVMAWGRNIQGQLGDGTRFTRTTPVWVTGQNRRPIGNISSVSTGGEHSIALTSDGYVLTWGKNAYGQLGFDPAGSVGIFSKRAMQVDNVFDIIQVSGEGPFTIARKSNGEVAIWGNNWYGQLATMEGTYGYGEERWQPGDAYKIENMSIQILDNIEYIASGHFHALAIDGSDVLWTWGNNANGQLGNGGTGLSARAKPIGQLE